jgi:hypothetical protein
MSDLTKFNKLLDALIKTIIKLCPDDISIKVGYEKFNLLTSFAPKKAWELFYINVNPLRDLILSRNEKFFLSREVQMQDIANSVSSEIGADNAFGTILNIKDAWVNRISDSDKEKIWKALEMLISISDSIALVEYSKTRG